MSVPLQAEAARRFAVGIANVISKSALDKFSPRLLARDGFRMPSHTAINAATAALGKALERRVSAIIDRETRSGLPLSDAEADERVAEMADELEREGLACASEGAAALER
jgi:hypothetical protein